MPRDDDGDETTGAAERYSIGASRLTAPGGLSHASALGAGGIRGPPDQRGPALRIQSLAPPVSRPGAGRRPTVRFPQAHPGQGQARPLLRLWRRPYRAPPTSGGSWWRLTLPERSPDGEVLPSPLPSLPPVFVVPPTAKARRYGQGATVNREGFGKVPAAGETWRICILRIKWHKAYLYNMLQICQIFRNQSMRHIV